MMQKEPLRIGIGGPVGSGKTALMDRLCKMMRGRFELVAIGGPAITRSDLLIINKIDLAPLVGASLAVMERDTRRMRGPRPFVFTNLKTGEGVDRVVDFVVEQGGL